MKGSHLGGGGGVDTLNVRKFHILDTCSFGETLSFLFSSCVT